MLAMSALLGQPPLNENDALIREAILGPLRASNMFPNPDLPFGPTMPSKDAPDEFNGQGMFALGVILIIAAVFMTVGRLIIRWRTKVPFGIDDGFAVLSMVR